MGEESGVSSYHVLKSVQGNFNQGNITLFGETAGRQCACNALFSVCWSVARKVSLWKSYDLDNILIEGDKLYKSLNKNDYLNVDELPRHIKIYNYNINIDMKLENLHEGIATHGVPFLQSIVNVSNVCTTGFLMFLCNYTIAIIPSYDRNGDLTLSGLRYFECTKFKGGRILPCCIILDSVVDLA